MPLRMASEGWQDELESTLEIAESAIEMADKEHMTDSFNQPVWDVTGAQVDVGAYLAGTPECMIDYPLTETTKVGRVITLVASISISGSISADTIAPTRTAYRGARAGASQAGPCNRTVD